MILKPLIRKESNNVRTAFMDKPNILPVSSNSSDALKQYEAIESTQYLELTGRLMMLSIVHSERLIRADKSNHDRLYRLTHKQWPVCECNYAKYIRGADIGFSWEVIENLRGVL